MKNRTIKYGCFYVFIILFSCTHINYSDHKSFISFKADGIERSHQHCPIFHSDTSYYVSVGMLNEKNEIDWKIEIYGDSLVTGKYLLGADRATYQCLNSGTYLSVGGTADSISINIDPASGMVTGHFSFLGFNGSDTIHITDGVFLGYK